MPLKADSVLLSGWGAGIAGKRHAALGPLSLAGDRICGEEEAMM